jgi:transcriptional/translational regulatory protein YebC/TACO1
VIVECLTENKNRTASNVRSLFRKGQLASSGAISWDFSHLGFVEATPPAKDADAETAAIEAGAQDFEPADGGTLFFTDTADVDVVSKALAGMGWTVTNSRLGWRAKNPVKVDSPEALSEVETFLADLDDDDDVQFVYVGLAT